MPDLSGVTVVVTRPAHQADNLCELIEGSGGTALRLPVIAIGAPENLEKCQRQLSQLAQNDIAIFVSANAVNATVELLQTPSAWPTGLATAAVGKATARALAANQLPVTFVAPEPFNSEALLSLPELQSLEGKRVCIFRGNGGRDFLMENLRERGAEVEYIECYQRVKPAAETAQLYNAWDQGQIMPIVVTSNESLENLLSMIDEQHRPSLQSAPLIVISERTAAFAKEQGFKHAPIVAESANDDALLAAVNRWMNR